MDADEACKTAIKLGLEGVAFTDHLDYDYPGEENFLIDFDKYFVAMEAMHKRYGDRLRDNKRRGSRDTAPCYRRNAQNDSSMAFDYVLASVHIIDGEDPTGKNITETNQRKGLFEVSRRNMQHDPGTGFV